MILTSDDSVESPELLKRLQSKGIGKFIACEVPVELAKAKYQVDTDALVKLEVERMKQRANPPKQEKADAKKRKAS